MKNVFNKFLNIFRNIKNNELNIRQIGIIAIDKEHLKELIQNEIEVNGYGCDLNHIDVSNITDMSFLFRGSHFNGNISKWDVFYVKNMKGMFFNSKFNGDISNWDVSNVKNMEGMFQCSKFNGDISNWNVSNVENMVSMFNDSPFNQNIKDWDVSNVKRLDGIFSSSEFKGDISTWKPYNLNNLENDYIKLKDLFEYSKEKPQLPYWANYQDKETRNKAIDSYNMQKELNLELSTNKNNKSPKLKL